MPGRPPVYGCGFASLEQQLPVRAVGRSLPCPIDRVSWRSSLDDFLGNTGSIDVGSLSLGTHLITASVTDLGGATGSASISITITDPDGGSTASLSSTGDAHTRDLSSVENKNYGKAPRTRVDSNGDRSAYMRFDTAGLPGPVSSATLFLSVEEVGNPGNFNLFRVQEDWDEYANAFRFPANSAFTVLRKYCTQLTEQVESTVTILFAEASQFGTFVTLITKLIKRTMFCQTLFCRW